MPKRSENFPKELSQPIVSVPEQISVGSNNAPLSCPFCPFPSFLDVFFFASLEERDSTLGFGWLSCGALNFGDRSELHPRFV